MNAVAVNDVPTTDTYGGLLREGETPEQGLRRLEKRRNFTKVIGTDEGQRLLAAAAAQVRAVPNGGIGRKRPVPATPLNADGDVILDNTFGTPPTRIPPGSIDVTPRGSSDVSDVTPPVEPEALACVGSNHVPGHSRGCPAFREPLVESVAAQLVDLPLELIDIGENVRREVGDLEGLASSIVELGVQQPVTVTPSGAGRYTLLLGQRRVLASRLAKLPTIRAIVVADPADVLAKPGARRASEQVAENRVRLAMNPVDEAVALRAILDGEKGLTQVTLAKRIGMSEPWIASTLALLKAPAEVQELVRTDTLSIAHAKAIAGLPAADQVRLAKSAASNGVSAHSLEETAKWERSRQSQTREQAGLAAKAAARGLIALDKAKTPKDVPLYVFASDWRIQDADVRKVIREEGYTVAEGWARTGKDRWAKCDCKALELQIRDGEGSTVGPACTSDAHWRAFEKERNAVAVERRAAEEADRKRLAGFVRAAMPAELIPVIGRLILRGLEGYQMKNWAEYSKIPDGKIRDAIADKLTTEAAIRGGYDAKGALPVKTIIRELGGVEENTPEPAPKAKHPRRRPPEAVKGEAVADA